MAPSTIEQAFALARSGQFSDFQSLKRRLKSDGCRAVDALLSPRTISRHLEAICAATFKPELPDDGSQQAELDGASAP